jgi:hypothetical protein
VWAKFWLIGSPKGFSAWLGYSSIAPSPAAWWTPHVSLPASFLLRCALGPTGRILPFPVARAIETAAWNSWESGPGIPQPGDKTPEGVSAAVTYPCWSRVATVKHHTARHRQTLLELIRRRRFPLPSPCWPRCRPRKLRCDSAVVTKEPDEDITSIHTMNGPITRSRAWQLILQVRSSLVNCVSELTLGAMDVLMIRNLGEDQQGLGKGLGVEEEQQGRPQQEGDQVRLGCDSISGSWTSLH